MAKIVYGEKPPIFGECSAQKGDECIINKAVEEALYTLMSTIYFTAICFASISIGALCIHQADTIFSIAFLLLLFFRLLFCLHAARPLLLSHSQPIARV